MDSVPPIPVVVSILGYLSLMNSRAKRAMQQSARWVVVIHLCCKKERSSPWSVLPQIQVDLGRS